MQEQKDEGPQISEEEMKRVRKAAQQLASYTNFMKWSANFKKGEVSKHPRHNQVFMLSPMQSSRFCFAVDGGTVFIGAQDFEAAWLAHLPLDKAFISDRLYVSVTAVSCMDSKFPPLAIGFFIDDMAKRKLIGDAKNLQIIPVTVKNGKVVDHGRAKTSPIPLVIGDVITHLFDAQQTAMKKQDMSRFL